MPGQCTLNVGRYEVCVVDRTCRRWNRSGNDRQLTATVTVNGMPLIVFSTVTLQPKYSNNGKTVRFD